MPPSLLSSHTPSFLLLHVLLPTTCAKVLLVETTSMEEGGVGSTSTKEGGAGSPQMEPESPDYSDHSSDHYSPASSDCRANKLEMRTQRRVQRVLTRHYRRRKDSYGYKCPPHSPLPECVKEHNYQQRLLQVLAKNIKIVKSLESRQTCTTVPESLLQEEFDMLKTIEERKRFRECIIGLLKTNKPSYTLTQQLDSGGQSANYKRFCSYLII